jgi:hypothetical protein
MIVAAQAVLPEDKAIWLIESLQAENACATIHGAGPVRTVDLSTGAVWALAERGEHEDGHLDQQLRLWFDGGHYPVTMDTAR